MKVFKSINVQTNSSNYGYNLITKYKKVDYISIDLPEAQLVVSSKSNDCKVLAKKFRKVNYNILSITRGHEGSSVFNRNKSSIDIPAMVSNTIDTMGAGDAYFSITSVMSYLGVKNSELGFIGNCAGGITSNIIGHSNYVDITYLKRFIETKLK